MAKAGRYLHVVFTCRQAVEKLSAAAGNFREGSDIDAGVVLDIENIEDEIAAGVELFQSSIKIDPDIEPFPILVSVKVSDRLI